MSCTFSKKFEPLVLSWAEDPNITPDEFYNKLQSYFGSDADTIFDIYKKKEGQITPSSFSMWETASARVGLGEGAFTAEGLSVKANYTGDFTGYSRMINAFKQAIIAASVYDISSGSFIDANEDINGYTALNRRLFDYKVQLINNILEALGRSPIAIDIDSPDAGVKLNDAITTVKSVYESNMRTTWDGFDAYVTLVNFNKLLEEQTPFIKVKSAFKHTTAHGVDMYSYEGPKAKLRQSWSKIDDIPGAEESYSRLANILLDLFPEVQKDNETPIPNTSVGTAGFASVMSTLRSALLYDSNPLFRSLREEYFKGAQMDMVKVIDTYLNYISNNDAFNATHYSFLEHKLRGIRKYIYAGNMQEDIKNMFTRMFFETVPISYMSYGQFQGKFEGKTLSERWLNSQNYNVQNTLNGRIYNFRSIPRKWQVVKANHRIKITGNATAGNISIVPKGTDAKLTIHYSVEGNNRIFFSANDVSTSTFSNEDALRQLIWDVTGYLVTPEYIAYSNSIAGKNHNVIQDFIDALGITILASDNSMISGNPLIDYGIVNTDSKQVNFSKMDLYNKLRTISTITGLIKGAETANTVKDVNGNNLPTRGLSDLAHQFKEQLYQYQQAINSGVNSFVSENLIFLNEDLVGEPIVREGISKNHKGKKARQLIEPELYECEIVYDFFTHLIGDGIVHLQNATFADKGKHYIWGYNLNKPLKLSARGYDTIDMLSLLRNVYRGSSESRKSAIEQLSKLYYDLRSKRYLKIEQNIIDKYEQVLGQQFESLQEVDQYLQDNKITYNQLSNAFWNEKIQFDDDFDAVKVGKQARINETLMNMLQTFDGNNNMERANKRIERNKRRFLLDLIDSGFKLNRYSSKGGQIIFNDELGKLSDWVDTLSGNVILAKVRKDGKYITIGRHNAEILMDPTYNVELNPMLESYFFADVILSNELNSLMIGETFSHKLKKNNGSRDKVVFDETEYEEFGEAGRLIAQDKRNVIPGASMHVFLQGLKEGVAENIEVAVMSDIPGYTYNMVGTTSANDSSDGSGISNIYEAMLEQNSLIDASNGWNVKTIGWDVDPATGKPMMLKWAVYPTTNETRRNGYNSTASVEDLHRKLNSKPIGFVDVTKYFNNRNGKENFYFFDNETGTYYKLDRILQFNIDGNTYFYKRCIVTDETGSIDENSEVRYLDKNNEILPVIDGQIMFTPEKAEKRLKLNTIYDLDVFFGGPYTKSLQNDGLLHYNDLNNRIVLDIICNEGLKDKFIAYAVNKSAFKVGYGNVNPEESWKNPKAVLRTLRMSTRHIGLQMNAEHELDESEVTEMTQMISALAENWYTGPLAREIYKDIGAVVDESLRSIGHEIETNDLDALRLRLGKALVDSFKTKEDTIGLAQAFLSKAEEAIRDSDARINIPFSASTINGAFVSTITSMLNKKGIRRKYAGVAAVLNPSYDMIQYYRYTDSEGNIRTQLHAGISEEIRKWKREHPEFSNNRIRNFINDLYLVASDNRTLIENPFVESITNLNDLRPEDTISVWNEEAEDWSDPIRLDSWETYNKYVNEGLTYNTLPQDGIVVKRYKLAPRNLKGADTTFVIDGQQYSIYNLDSVRAAHGDAERFQKLINDPYFAEDIIEGNAKQTIQNIIQHQLKDLSRGILHDSKFTNEFGETLTINPENVTVEPAECILGRLNAEKFGLKEGDQVDDILKEGWRFFAKRLVSKYQFPTNLSDELYDLILYTRNGPLFVKIGDIQNPERFNITRNRNIESVDGNLIYADMNLVEDSGIKRYATVVDNQEYNILCVDNTETINRLIESDAVDTYRFNTAGNWIAIAKYLDPKGEIYARPTAQESLDALTTDLKFQFQKRLERLAINRFEAFNMSLNVVGARIPTQAMQSFMPMRIVAVTDDLVNNIYVTRWQTWLQGSDYDVDKLYTLAYSIADNGTLPTLSKLTYDFPVDEVLRLPLPDGRIFTESKNGIRVSFAELAQVTGINPNETLFGTRTLLFDPNQFSRTPFDLESFVRILNSNETEISFEEPNVPIAPVGLKRNERRTFEQTYYVEQQIIFNKAKRDFLRYLNKHSRSKISNNREMALRNNVVWGVFKATTNPINQINAHAPIEMVEAQKAAEQTALSNAEKHVSSDTPSTKFKIQQQAMVGKEVTGISAVSVKVFFAETTYFNTVLESIADLINSGQTQDAVDVLSNLVMPNVFVKDDSGRPMPALVANANVKNVLEKINNAKYLAGVHADGLLDRWNTVLGFDLESCLQYLDKSANQIDAALSLSGLLSSSTDNMKELILPKLNATAQFVDIYTTLISSGISLSDVAKVLTSPMFTAASKLAQSNLFVEETTGYNVEKALGFYLNEDTLPHVSRTLIKLALENAGYKPTYDNLFDFLAYNKNDNYSEDPNKRNGVVKTVLSKLYELRNNKSSAWSDDSFEDYFDGEYDEYSDRKYLKDVTISELNNLINFFEQVINRNEEIWAIEQKSILPEYASYGNAETQLNNLRLIKDNVIPKTEEQRIFGQMLGINQGMRTDSYSLYAMMRRIENHINKRIDEFNKSGQGKVNGEFNLLEFLNPDNSDYREIWKNNYDYVKSSFNILRAITSVPHFNRMFDVLYTNNWILSKFSVKYDLVNRLARELERRNPFVEGNNFDRVLTENEYNEIEKYINDLLIIGWLQNQNLSITLPADNIQYESSIPQVLHSAKTIKLDNLYDFATFKNWMETYVIPELQSRPEYQDKSFIQSLEVVAQENRRTGKIERFYRLPLNMMTIDDSVKTQHIYENLLNSFDEISDMTFNGWKLSDLFFVYNLIVNKDGFGHSSFTRLFENLVSAKKGSSFVNSFYDYISNLDKDLENRDAMYNGIVNTNMIKDLEDRIVLNVTNSSIKGTSDSIKQLPSDFTFWAPSLIRSWRKVKQTVFPFELQSNTLHNIQLTPVNIRMELINHIKDLYGEQNVEVHSQNWFEQNFPNDESAKSNPAFIDNGKLYLKIDSRDNVPATVHELSHLILAGLRWNSNPEYRKFYYDLMDSIDPENFKNYLNDKVVEEYQKNRVGVDLKEEILAKALENYFINDVLPEGWRNGVELQSNSDKLLNVLNDLYGIRLNSTEEFFRAMKSNPSDVLRLFGSTLFDFNWIDDLSKDAIINTQRIADLKNRLTRNNLLQETECE